MQTEALELKICEGCGRLWVRAQRTREVYCAGCEERLAHFPLAGTARRPGRKRRKLAMQAGGVQ